MFYFFICVFIWLYTIFLSDGKASTADTVMLSQNLSSWSVVIWLYFGGEGESEGEGGR